MGDKVTMTVDEDLLERALQEEAAEEAAAKYAPKPRIRAAHQCRHEGCDSAWEWDLYLHVRYGRHHVAVESIGPIKRVRCCERHRKAATNFVLSDVNKKIISVELAKIGRLCIDWDNAMIEYVPRGEAPWGPVACKRSRRIDAYWGVESMATLQISEFEKLGNVIGSGAAQVAPLDLVIATQTVAISGTSAQSTALNVRTKYVRLDTDTRCAVTAAADPTALTTMTPLEANLPEYFSCSGGVKIAAITI
jgi:hypothetical protein